MRATVPGLTCYEELDFGIRQTRLIRPAVLQPGYDYRTPYLDEQWVRFIMGAPPEFRQGKKLYRAILAETWPRAFHIPSKGDYGAPITSPGWYRSLARRRLPWGKRLQRKLASERRRSLCWGTLARLATPPWRMLNYLDLAQGMRDRPDVREVVETNVFDLARRGVVPWLDIEKIWAAHQSGARNHADALTVLAQLEVNLKAEEREG